MGLLDALFPQSDGGLLDFLKGNAAFQRPTDTGLPSDQAQYPGQPQYAPQPSPMNAMAQAPIPPAGMPQAAQPPIPANPPPVIPAQPMPAVAPPSPGLGSNLMAGYQSLRHGGGLIGGLVGGITGQRVDDQGIAQQQQAQVANQTARALIGKGVDPQVAIASVQPGNAEMLKALITQSFGPPKAPTALGSGYIYNPQTNKVERAYEPEDKIPAGYERTADGKGLQFIKGGPEDPATKLRLAKEGVDPNAPKVLGRGGEVYRTNPDGTVTVLHKNESPADAPMLTPEGVDLAANRILNGEKGVTTGFSRSKGDMSAIYNRVAELAKSRGVDASDILSNINNEYAAASAARSFGGMTAKQETYSNTAAKAIDIAEKASEAVPRTTWVPVNKAILAWREKTGDPKVAALGQSLETLTQEYARAVGGGHGTVSDKEEAREYLAKAQTHDQLVARFNIMRQEIARGRESVGESAAHVGEVYRKNIRRGSALPDPDSKEGKAMANSPLPEPPKAPVKIDGYTITEH
ncbi:MAG TPA: hypothetical protein VJ846_10890 [Sphingomicrobium sp.]|nr:hypothetical protein [Sphingomicrobium sp.]